jgi:hypothetical protein
MASLVLKPLLSEQHFSPADLESAYARVEAGSLWKVVIEIGDLARVSG